MPSPALSDPSAREQTMPDMSKAAYRPTARALHWIVALIVFAMIPAGVVMLTPGLDRPTQNLLFMFHKNTGVVVLLLVLWRLVYRAMNTPPPLPASISPLQARVAGLTHLGLYAALLVMAISGYVRVVAGGFPLEFWDAIGVPRLVPKSETLAATAKAIHANARFALVALIAAHVGAALYHLVVKRDGVFARMWPSAGR
jgi:cytochrome b561